METIPETNKEYHEAITEKSEIEALEKFKIALKALIDKKDKPFLNSNSSLLLDNDILIRFLRARKLNIKKSTEMIVNYCEWKEKINLDKLYLAYEFKPKNKLKTIFPHGFHKTTKDGYPIYLHVMSFYNPEEFFKIGSPDEITTYAASVIEILNREYFKICSQVKNTYIYGVYGILDFKGINSSILSNKFFGYVKSLLKLQDYYPEIIAGIIIINTGFLFRTFFTACKVFIDSKTKKKIKVYSDKYQEGLLEVIDKENIPKFFGGNCDCPEGCLFSNAGPWKKEDEKNEIIPDDIIKKRKEINDIMLFGKIKASPEDENKSDIKGEIKDDKE